MEIQSRKLRSKNRQVEAPITPRAPVTPRQQVQEPLQNQVEVSRVCDTMLSKSEIAFKTYFRKQEEQKQQILLKSN